MNDATTHGLPAIAAKTTVDERVDFLRKTYVHLAGAIAAFAILETLLIGSPLGDRIATSLLGTRFGWLLVLVGFMAVGGVANRWAHSQHSRQTQYLGLAVYVVAQAILFVPLLHLAAFYSSPDVIPCAAITTLSAFTGLTAIVLISKKDFTFLGMALKVGMFVALGLIVASMIFGVSLALWFSVGMAVLAAGYVLYDTSNILRNYRTDQHVAASLALFSSIALMFWYVLQIFMSRD